ncbi:mannose-6-phosphate isomerase, class I [Occultella glacieicola]|uniref:mannose-6-phosphate isomerase n=1 Tax=Occultella glacieicola TaxID=2518684 RepID=A0ABY2E7Y3_9MICO|nr:mannose-6-phosphate isomerase, class I [Occultella glacieicola]TDE96129.1 mannose-6-phosphate isomerase, class I [Occultella glacieicola]
MRALTGSPRDYAWGSPTVIPEFLGASATDRPVAELWFGAHPSAPSVLADDGELRTHLAGDPSRILGLDIVARFGPTLPYLLKVIAPVRPLSLQVHPDLNQAQAGHAREQAAGVDPLLRTYADANHKPELVYALTDFEAVSGFRAPRRAAELLKGLDTPLAEVMRGHLQASPTASGVREAFTHLLVHGSDGATSAVEETAAACVARLGDGRSPSERTDTIVANLSAAYPGDPGSVAALLLNPVTLHPGEAMFVPAGGVHAYLSGFAVELMANSDNVLRAGLTPKRVDIPEVLATIDWVAAPPIRIAPEMFDECTGVYYAPVDDFELSVATLDGEHRRRIPGRGPRLLLCLDGEVAVTSDVDPAGLTVTRGQCVFVAADEGAVRLSGTGRLAQAGVP